MGSVCIPLNVIGDGKYAEVSNIEGGELMGKKLIEMGMNKGTIVQMLRNDAGPLIVKVGETRLVLGRGMAQKVMVREV